MIHITNESIPAGIYQQLRVSAGLSPKSDKAAEIGLANTVHFTAVKDTEENYIGMGRIIGDGGTFCQVVDICVLPEWQGKGIGKMIMQDIIDFIETQLPGTCYISLLADGDAYKLYEQYGFKDTMPKSRGMFLMK